MDGWLVVTPLPHFTSFQVLSRLEFSQCDVRLSTFAGSGFSLGIYAICLQCLVLDAMAAPEAGCTVNYTEAVGDHSIKTSRHRFFGEAVDQVKFRKRVPVVEARARTCEGTTQ